MKPVDIYRSRVSDNTLIFKKEVELLLDGEIIKKVKKFDDIKKLISLWISITNDLFLIIISLIMNLLLKMLKRQLFKLLLTIRFTFVLIDVKIVETKIVDWLLNLIEVEVCNIFVENYFFIIIKNKIFFCFFMKYNKFILYFVANACSWKEYLNKKIIISIILISMLMIKWIGFYFLKNCLLNKNFSLKSFSGSLTFSAFLEIILGLVIKII